MKKTMKHIMFLLATLSAQAGPICEIKRATEPYYYLGPTVTTDEAPDDPALREPKLIPVPGFNAKTELLTIFRSPLETKDDCISKALAYAKAPYVDGDLNEPFAVYRLPQHFKSFALNRLRGLTVKPGRSLYVLIKLHYVWRAEVTWWSSPSGRVNLFTPFNSKKTGDDRRFTEGQPYQDDFSKILKQLRKFAKIPLPPPDDLPQKGLKRVFRVRMWECCMFGGEWSWSKRAAFTKRSEAEAYANSSGEPLVIIQTRYLDPARVKPSFDSLELYQSGVYIEHDDH